MPDLPLAAREFLHRWGGDNAGHLTWERMESDLAELVTALRQEEWIACETRLPPQGEIVLIWAPGYAGAYCDLGQWDGKCWWEESGGRFNAGEIRWWQPVPPGPKAEQAEQPPEKVYRAFDVCGGCGSDEEGVHAADCPQAEEERRKTNA